MTLTELREAVRAHIQQTWPDEATTLVKWELGRNVAELPDLVSVRIFTGRNGYAYVSLGVHELETASGHVEFVLLSPRMDDGLVEILAMMSSFARDFPERIFQGGGVRIGRPWLPGSNAQHLLITKPYPIGYDFEHLEVDGSHIRFFWLLPILDDEYALLREHDGYERLELEFEAKAINFLDPNRSSVLS